MPKQPRQNTRGTGGEAAAAASSPRPQRAARRQESVRQRKEARRKAAERQQRQGQLARIGLGVIAVLIVAGLIWFVVDRVRTVSVSADVTTYFSANDFTGVHPQDVTEILYEQVPPVGGPHNSVWQNCGYYDTYIFNWHGVHALEHGAVWLTFDPNLSEDDRETLKKKADQSYVLVSPYPGLDAPVVGSVWGKQMAFDGVDDDRIDAFIKQYKRNPGNTPEPNAVCWGGTSLTTDQEPQQQPYQQVDASAPPIGGITITDATATAEAQEAPASTPEASPEGAATPPAS